MDSHHQVVIVDGGTAGISVASQLRKEVNSIAVIDPADKHYYQPLGPWSVVVASSAKRAGAPKHRSFPWCRLDQGFHHGL
ncbi:MAG: hypothetical protein P8L46_16310 [Acidimicrobiales bacterium]|nr:hypothetical protein [Acidimicrobiales bacterium]MDG2219604.1 hypothetical protein [Acidimicrobiales bacterium]